MKPTMYVVVSLQGVRVSWYEERWERGTRWNSSLWLHPECTILYHREKSVKKLNWKLVANAIMNALQSEGLRSSQLTYNRYTPCRKRKVDPAQGTPL